MTRGSRDDYEQLHGLIVASACPLLIFFGTKRGGFAAAAAVGMPQSFASNGASGLEIIEQDTLKDPNTMVLLNVLKPSVDRASSDTLIFRPSRTRGTVTISGSLVRPLNPELCRYDSELCFKIYHILLKGVTETLDETVRCLIQETKLVFHT